MKRFITFLISAGIAWWAWWYTFTVDPGGEGFGWEACDDGEGICTDDPSIFYLLISIVAGTVAFFALLSTIRLIKRKLRGETIGGPQGTKGVPVTWVDSPSAAAGWGEQVATSIQQGIAAAQQAQARAQASYPAVSDPAQGDPSFGVPVVGNPAMVGQAGVIGSPAAGSPTSGDPSAGPSAAAPNAAIAASGVASAAAGAASAAASRTRVPNAADRAASKDRWLRRAGGGGGTGDREGRSTRHTSSLTGVPDLPIPTVPAVPAGPVASGEASPAADSHPSTGTVVLRSVGPRDLGVQREVRKLTGFGLEEAKQLMAAVAGEPQVIAADLPWEQAQAAKRTLVKMGAEVEVR